MSGPTRDSEGGGWGGKRTRAETWDEFDALPVAVKRLFWSAPYLYTAALAAEALWQGHDVTNPDVLRGQRAAMRLDVQREARRLYGPHHPQAKRP